MDGHIQQLAGRTKKVMVFYNSFSKEGLVTLLRCRLSFVCDSFEEFFFSYFFFFF